MNKESNCSSSSTNSTDESHPLSLPLFLSASSSCLKPLRDRNRTNLKRRINLSRSQVLSNDFENEDNLPRTNSTHKSVSTTNNSQSAAAAPPSSSSSQPSTPMIHTHAELYSKTASPKTPSPIHTTVTCSQVWERLASNEEHQTTVSQKSNVSSSSSSTASNIPTHIYFTYDQNEENNDDDDDEIQHNDKDDFQYVPVSSQSKLVQFQFLTFARQQLDVTEENTDSKKKDYDSDEDDDEEDEDEDDEDTLIDYGAEEGGQDNEGQENRPSKKRKRSVSTTDSLDGIPPFSDRTTNDATSAEATASSSSATTKPRNKKPKIKDPNANFQRLNMRKKNFSHAKKHQFAKHKRNAFYRRMRNAGGK